MAKLNQASSKQLTLGAFSQGNFASLDGGKRLRMDDRVDYWPGTGRWQDSVTREQGDSVSSMLAHVARVREGAGQAVSQAVPVLTNRRLVCNHCGQPAQLHTGKDVYPNHAGVVDRYFWVCWPCDAWVGCHQAGDGQQPMGHLAKEDLRSARIAAHKALDGLWNEGEMTREAAYEWLARALGIPSFRCRIAMMDLEDCARITAAVAKREIG
jgi:zinc-finger-containing domain